MRVAATGGVWSLDEAQAGRAVAALLIETMGSRAPLAAGDDDPGHRHGAQPGLGMGKQPRPEPLAAFRRGHHQGQDLPPAAVLFETKPPTDADHTHQATITFGHQDPVVIAAQNGLQPQADAAGRAGVVQLAEERRDFTGICKGGRADGGF